MPVPIARYRASRHYTWAGLAGLSMAAFSGAIAVKWPLVWIAAFLFFVSAAIILVLTLRPPIDIFETHLRIGRRTIPWLQIRRLDRLNGWVSPLVISVTLADNSRYLMVYLADLDAVTSLLRHMRRFAREALIDGIPYREFWREAPSSSGQRKHAVPPRYPLLLADDEAEVERLFQRLKSVGHLDSKTSPEDK